MTFSRIRTFAALSMLAVALSACSFFQTREDVRNYVDDNAVTARIKQAYAADANVRTARINVGTNRGVVQLTGFAEKAEIAAKAVDLAEDVDGVKKVDDNIIVRPPHGSSES